MLSANSNASDFTPADGQVSSNRLSLTVFFRRDLDRGFARQSK
jgi:hypothetical protein